MNHIDSAGKSEERHTQSAGKSEQMRAICEHERGDTRNLRASASRCAQSVGTSEQMRGICGARARNCVESVGQERGERKSCRLCGQQEEMREIPKFLSVKFCNFSHLKVNTNC